MQQNNGRKTMLGQSAWMLNYPGQVHEIVGIDERVPMLLLRDLFCS